MANRLLFEKDVIRAVDKHTNDDNKLDDDISCILEEIKNCKRLVSRGDVSEPSKIILDRAYFECILVDGTRVDFDKVYTYKDVPLKTFYPSDIERFKSENEEAFNREYYCKYETV